MKNELQLPGNCAAVLAASTFSSITACLPSKGGSTRKLAIDKEQVLLKKQYLSFQ
jgi:hypothetical protein